MLEWSKEEDFWVRRIAIDHQLCRKEKTNSKLLEAILVNNFGSNEFFINKAISWSLRDYSKANSEMVKEFVEKYKERWTNNVGLMNGLVISITCSNSNAKVHVIKYPFSKIMINFLNDFEQERPACQPWSLVPILCVLVGLMTLIAIAFLAKYINKTKNKKLLNGIILIYGLLFLGLEIYHEINRYFFFGYYDFSSIPFQFCSIPIYLCLILPFIKNEKIRMPIFYYLGIYCMIAGIFPLLFGQGQLCRWSNISDVFRSFLWHVLILQVSILSVVHAEIGKNIKKDYKYFLGAVAIFVGLTVIAQLINVTLHYTGGINYKPTDGKPFKDVMNTPLFDPDVASCFYISPFFVSNMPVYSQIWLKFGWLANYIIYVISFSFLATILYFLNSLIKYCMIKYAAWRIKNK